MKIKKYKVDEWVLYNMISEPTDKFDYSKRALIVNLCENDDFYDYEIYIENTQEFKKVKERYLFPLK